MKKIVLIIGLIAFNTLLIHAQVDVKSKITQAALDYADGFYSGDYERIGNVLHPELNKIYVYKIPQTNRVFLDYASISHLIEYTRSNAGFLEADKRNIKTKIISIIDNVAVVKLMSAQFNDFLHLVRMNEKWQILNVLWSAGPETRNPSTIELNKEIEKPLIEAVINDYHKGQFSAQPDLLEKVIHPEISIAQMSKIEKTGRSSIRRSGKSQLIELSRLGVFRAAEDKRTVNIFDIEIMNEMATVRAETEKLTSYFQLQKIDKAWKIINVLNVPKK